MVKKRNYSEPFERRVLRFILDNNLLSGKLQLLVAVSGGPDSVCMLHILVKIREELDLKLHLAHLNHKLRGAESEADAEYVSGLARQFGIPATVEARDVKEYKDRERTTLEEAAREVRYAYFAEVAESVGADRVAAGHTADDNVETVLLHLIRGTGTRGLRGLQPVSKWQSSKNSLVIIRPLLESSRQETVEYCREHGLEPRIDSSNLSLSPLRNRIRLQLLPMLESYNPQVAEALLRTARIAGDDLDALDAEVIRLRESVTRRQGDTLIFDKESFIGLAPAWQRHLLRKSIEELLGSLKDIEVRHIEDIIAALDKPAGRSIDLPGGLVFVIEYDRCLLTNDAAEISPYPVIDGEVNLAVPGETRFSGWLVKTEIINREDMSAEKDDFTAYLSLDKVGDIISVRSRRRGDRFYPLGIGQPKKLGEFMIDDKIPRSWRANVPIVCSPEQILWITGSRIDDRAKVTDATVQVLRLEFKRV
ncbi:tRNA lysidine(34) synthetase TilS [Chloroflexota bacterium]